MSHFTVVVVLNFNGLSDTLACLATLAPQRRPHLEVLVVDNASTDDPTHALCEGYPEIPVLRLSENRGWAGGNNAGIDWARARGADIVCLLNNDTLVPDGSIERLASTARSLGPCLLHPAIDYAEPGAGAQLDPSRWKNSRRLAGHKNVHVLTYAYGACLVVPTAVFEQIGVFDERFFLQLEESDFFTRAQKHGIPSLCLPEVRIVHAESRSFGSRFTPAKTYYISRNTLLFSRKHDRHFAGRFRAVQKLYWTLAGLANFGLKTPLSHARVLGWMLSRNPHAKAARYGVYDYIRRRFGKMDAEYLR
jgi:GT2 family glycosyltransferase